MNIIEEFYYGNIDPQELCCKIDSNEKELLNTIADREKILTECLDEDKKKIFLEFLNANSEFDGLDEIKRFMTGWRLGARFILDTFVTNEN